MKQTSKQATIQTEQQTINPTKTAASNQTDILAEEGYQSSKQAIKQIEQISIQTNKQTIRQTQALAYKQSTKKSKQAIKQNNKPINQQPPKQANRQTKTLA